MNNLPYRNVAGSKNHVEQWLEKILTTSYRIEVQHGLHEDSISFGGGIEDDSLSTVTNVNQTNNKTQSRRSKYMSSQFSGLEELGLHRDTLFTQYQLDESIQDRIYRSLFVYVNGIHEFIKEIQQQQSHVPNLSMKLFEAFFRLFQYYDIQCREQFVQYLYDTQNHTMESTVMTLREQNHQLAIDNENLIKEIALIQVQLSSQSYTHTIETQTSTILLNSLQNKLQYYEKEEKKVKNQEMEMLQNCYQEALSTIVMLKETLPQLVLKLQKTNDDLHRNQLLTQHYKQEYDQLNKNYKKIEQINHDLNEEMIRFKRTVIENNHEIEQFQQQILELTQQIQVQQEMIVQLQHEQQQSQQIEHALFTINEQSVNIIEHCKFKLSKCLLTSMEYEDLFQYVLRPAMVELVSTGNSQWKNLHQDSAQPLLQQSPTLSGTNPVNATTTSATSATNNTKNNAHSNNHQMVLDVFQQIRVHNAPTKHAVEGEHGNITSTASSTSKLMQSLTQQIDHEVTYLLQSSSLIQQQSAAMNEHFFDQITTESTFEEKLAYVQRMQEQIQCHFPLSAEAKQRLEASKAILQQQMQQAQQAQQLQPREELIFQSRSDLHLITPMPSMAEGESRHSPSHHHDRIEATLSIDDIGEGRWRTFSDDVSQFLTPPPEEQPLQVETGNMTSAPSVNDISSHLIENSIDSNALPPPSSSATKAPQPSLLSAQEISKQEFLHQLLHTDYSLLQDGFNQSLQHGIVDILKLLPSFLSIQSDYRQLASQLNASQMTSNILFTPLLAKTRAQYEVEHELTTRLQDQIKQQQQQIQQLNQQIVDLQVIEEKYKTLQPKFMDLVEHYKEKNRLKREVEQHNQVLKEQNGVLTKAVQYQEECEAQIRSLTKEVEEKDGYIQFLKQEQMKFAKQALEDRAAASLQKADGKSKRGSFMSSEDDIGLGITAEMLETLLQGVRVVFDEIAKRIQHEEYVEEQNEYEHYEQKTSMATATAVANHRKQWKHFIKMSTEAELIAARPTSPQQAAHLSVASLPGTPTQSTRKQIVTAEATREQLLDQLRDAVDKVKRAQQDLDEKLATENTTNRQLEMKKLALRLMQFDAVMEDMVLLPGKVDILLQCVDEVQQARSKYHKLELEYEKLKMFCSKERRRIALQYEEKLQVLIDQLAKQQQANAVLVASSTSGKIVI